MNTTAHGAAHTPASQAKHEAAAGAGAELHIASLVVHAAPAQVLRVRQALAALPAAEVHAHSAAGKLVLTLEAPTGRAMSAHIDAIQQTEGVLSAVLVYQCADSLQTMNEEI